MSIEKIINDAWENKDQVNQNSEKSLKDAVNQIINDLDSGKSRVAEKIDGNWPAFGKMSCLWRTHHGVSEILELIDYQQVEQAAATAVQLLKAIHQAALDQGSWSVASTLLPWEVIRLFLLAMTTKYFYSIFFNSDFC